MKGLNKNELRRVLICSSIEDRERLLGKKERQLDKREENINNYHCDEI